MSIDKAVLFLLGKKGFQSLYSLIECGFSLNISTVVIGRDTAISNDYYFAIIQLCEEKEIPWIEKRDFTALNENEVAFLISWKWLIKGNTEQLIVLHDSILPKYRGFNPLVTALINGDGEIGVTAILPNEGIDEGDIIDQKVCKINYPITIGEAIEVTIGLYSAILKQLFTKIFILKDKLIGYQQNNENSTFSLWRDETDYFIDWGWDSTKIKRFIDAVSDPYDGAKFYLNNEVVKVLRSEVVKDVNIANRVPGKLFRINGNSAIVVCGIGLLEVSNCSYVANNQKVKFEKLRVRLDSI
jgi:methionyl-tRNA formyltransferase